MKIGIVGLPNVGKSSLFNLLTSAGAAAEAYPFTTIDANHGMAMLPDAVLDRLGKLLVPPKLTFAHIEVVDIAGLVSDAHRGEGLGNKFLGHIRDVDLILHVIRGFASSNVPHVFETIDPVRDQEIILSELALADLEVIERRLLKQRKRAEAKAEVALLDRFNDRLSEGNFSLNSSCSPEEIAILKSIGLLIPRPQMNIINLEDTRSDIQIEDAYRISISLEEGMEEFPNAEKIELRRDASVDTRGPWGVLDHALDMLGLICFYTIKGEEVRAWTLKRGSTAIEAAQKIHTDISAGFIKAEVVNAEALLAAGSWKEAASQGKLKVEGKDYVVQDGDVLLVKFR